MATAISARQAQGVTNGQLPPGALNGDAHPLFAPVVSYFGQLFNSGSRGGGALAVRWHGRPVVDVWAGFADRRLSQPWERDTVTVCFSTTKGVAFTVIHRLADRGLVDYEAPVASYWPEFGVAGKQAITVRQLLSHQAGLHSMVDLVDRFADPIEQVAPLWNHWHRPNIHWFPGGHIGYAVRRDVRWFVDAAFIRSGCFHLGTVSVGA